MNVGLRKREPARVLAYGYDGLVLAIDVLWNDESLLSHLAELKDQAKASDQPMPGIVRPSGAGWQWVYNVEATGSKGYEWMLVGREYSMKVGRWLSPKDRPSVMVTIRAETLWHLSPRVAVDRVGVLLATMGGRVASVKASRADLCVDILFPARRWSMRIIDQLVTRAAAVDPHLHRGLFSGVSIGRGTVVARLYDKPLEIRVKKNKKVWMYGIWKLDRVPDGHVIARVEFQFRREALKELGIFSIDDLFAKGEALWSYATRKWLKVQDDPGVHHTQQHTLPWWKVVRAGFGGAQFATPLVRSKAIEADREQLARQIFGSITSLAALNAQGDELAAGATLSLSAEVEALHDLAPMIGMDDDEATTRARKKLAKFRRAGGEATKKK